MRLKKHEVRGLSSRDPTVSSHALQKDCSGPLGAATTKNVIRLGLGQLKCERIFESRSGGSRKRCACDQ